MPSISGLGSYPWSDYKSLSQNTKLFYVIALCPKCGFEWKSSPTKTTLSDSSWSLVSHLEKKVLIWVEGWAKMLCPKCDGIATFHFGVHREGCATVGPHDDAFDAEWWIDPDERRKP